MSLAHLSLFLLFAPACGGSDLCGEAEGNDGGFSKVDLDDAEVVAAADFAAAELSQEEAPVYELICAQSQVVDGTNYRLGLDLEDSTWRVEVYEDFDGVLELSSSEQVED